MQEEESLVASVVNRPEDWGLAILVPNAHQRFVDPDHALAQLNAASGGLS